MSAWASLRARVRRDSLGAALLVLNIALGSTMAYLALAHDDVGAALTLCVNVLAVSLLGRNFAEPLP